MTVLGIDNFKRANQSTWGTSSGGVAWNHARGSSNWNIASNEGTVDTASGFYNVFAYDAVTAKDAELLVRYTPGASGDSGGLTIRHIDQDNFYYCDIGNLGQFAEIGKDVATTFTTIGSVAFSWSVGVAYWMRFRVVGTHLSLKVWADGSPEPNSWLIDVTDSSHSAAGLFGVACNPASAAAMKYDSFYAVDYANCENLSVTDSFLRTDTASFVEANSASDTFSRQGSFVPVDGLSTSESLLAQGSYSATDSLSALDSFLAQSGASWLEVNAIVDSFSAGGIYQPVAALAVQDTFAGSTVYVSVESLSVADLQSALQSWGVDALIISDGFTASELFQPVNALSATETWLSVNQLNWFELLQATDSFSGTAGPPAVLPTPLTIIIARCRDGLVVARGRDNHAVALSRDGQTVARGR